MRSTDGVVEWQARGGVVIVGGGFAGASVARRLGRRGATIVSTDNFLLYTPLLPDAAAGTLEPRHIVMPLRQLCRHADVVVGDATSIDEARRVLSVATDAGSLSIHYEQIVFAPGSVSRSLLIPGLGERGIGFESLADAVHLRNTIIHRLDAADEATRLRAESSLSFVFVGGGYAGVEAIAQLHDLAQHALRYYPRLREVPQRWLLVDAAPSILSAVPGALGTYAARQLSKAGIELHLATHLVSAENGHIVLSDGTELEAETLVWAAGRQPNPLGARFGFPFDDRGRVIVDATLQVKGRANVFALGDAAAVPNQATGELDPPTAQHALRQGKHLAANLEALAANRPLRPYGYRTRGQTAILGHHRAVAVIGTLRLRGLAAWLLARTYHLLHLPLRANRALVAADWAVALVFPRDISQLASIGQPQPLAHAAARGATEPTLRR
jgi:NADH dehydrogenase